MATHPTNITIQGLQLFKVRRPLDFSSFFEIVDGDTPYEYYGKWQILAPDTAMPFPYTYYQFKAAAAPFTGITIAGLLVDFG